jgi:predicted secreted Zn-dependent protease
MGLMDKMKAQATQISQKAQETARDGKVKFDQAQAKRRADAMLRNLGALVYAERTGRAAADTQAQVDKLIADISAHEAENGISLSPESADQNAGGAGHQSGSTGFPPSAPTGTSASTGFPPESSTTQV